VPRVRCIVCQRVTELVPGVVYCDVGDDEGHTCGGNLILHVEVAEPRRRHLRFDHPDSSDYWRGGGAEAW
jgi:hypothetical protein